MTDDAEWSEMAAGLASQRAPGRHRRSAQAERRNSLATILDQGVSSLSNVAIALLVAHEVSPSRFGIYSIGYLTTVFATGVSRSFVSETLLVRHGSVGTRPTRSFWSRALGAALDIGLVLCAGVAFAGLLSTGELRSVLFIFAIALPFVLVQDCSRYILICMHRAGEALINDSIWVIVQLAILGGLIVTHHNHRPASFAAVWAISAALCAVLGCAQVACAPRLRSAGWWARRYGSLSWRYTGEFVMMNGTAQIAQWSMAAVAGPAVVGAVQAGQVLYGPVRVLLLAAVPAGITEFRRRMGNGSTLHDLTKRSAALLGGTAAAYAVLVLVLPRSIGVRVLGANWAGAHSVAALLGAAWLVVGVFTAVLIALRVDAAARNSFRGRMIASPFNLALPIVGCALWDAKGGAGGMLAANCVLLVAMVAQYLGSRRHSGA